MKKIIYAIMMCLTLSFTSCSKVVKLAKPLSKEICKSEKILIKRGHGAGKFSNRISNPSTCTSTAFNNNLLGTRCAVAGGKIIRKRIEEKQNKEKHSVELVTFHK